VKPFGWRGRALSNNGLQRTVRQRSDSESGSFQASNPSASAGPASAGGLQLKPMSVRRTSAIGR